jgi:hypothetical protein
MIIPSLSKLYGIILENKISAWLEFHGKRAQGWVGFRSYHSTMDHLVMLRMIMEECQNNKYNLLRCFIDFRKSIHTIPRTNLWNRLEELKVPPQLRVVNIRLYRMLFPSIGTLRIGQKKSIII